MIRYISSCPGGPSRRELIDERDQREIFGIREEEPAQAADAGGRAARRRARAVSHVGDGRAREPAGDGGIPSLVGQAVVGDLVLQQARRGRHRGRTLVNPAAAAAIGPVVAKSRPENPCGLQLAARRPARARTTVPLRSDPLRPRRAVPRRNPPRTVRTRPPTRSRASTTVTIAPAASRSRAAVSPASPPPATITRTPESSRVAIPEA